MKELTESELVEVVGGHRHHHSDAYDYGYDTGKAINAAGKVIDIMSHFLD